MCESRFSRGKGRSEDNGELLYARTIAKKTLVELIEMYTHATPTRRNLNQIIQPKARSPWKTSSPLRRRKRGGMRSRKTPSTRCQRRQRPRRRCLKTTTRTPRGRRRREEGGESRVLSPGRMPTLTTPKTLGTGQRVFCCRRTNQ